MIELSEVDYKEADSIRVGKWLQTKEYFPADSDGEAISSLVDKNEIGVLCGHPESYKSTFFGLVKTRKRRIFLGIIYFRGNRGADDEHWSFLFYGSMNADAVKKLAKEMSEEFKVKIYVTLISEEPKIEMLERDFYW